MEQPRNPALDMTDIASKLAPLLFGQKQATNSSTTGTVDPSQLASSDALIAMLTQQGSSTAQSDGIVQDILHRAQLAFAPILGEEKSAGMYNSQTRTMMAQEAVARATAASAQAVMDNQQKALATAAQLQGTNVQATRSTSTKTTENKASQGKNILGTVAATVLAHKAVKSGGDVFDKAMAQLDSLRGGDEPEQLAGPTGDGGDAASLSAGTPIGSEEFLAAADVPVDVPAVGELGALDPNDPAFQALGSEEDPDLISGSDGSDTVGDGGGNDTLGGDGVDGSDAVDASDSSDFLDDFDFEDFSDFFADGGIVPVSRAGYTEQANLARQNKRVPTNIVAGGNLTSSASNNSLVAKKRGVAIDDLTRAAQQTGDASAAAALGDSVGPAPAGLGLGLSLAGIGLSTGIPGIGLAVAIANALANSGVGNTGGQGLGLGIATDSEGPTGLGLDAEGNPVGENGVSSTTGNANSGTGAEAGDSSATGLAGNAATAGESGAPAGDTPGGDASPGGDAGTASSDGDAGGAAAGAGDGGGSGDGGAEFDGGIQMANTVNESSGIDKKIIHVTPGESVLPVDTTEALQKLFGPNVIEDLIAATHTPLKKQAGRRR